LNLASSSVSKFKIRERSAALVDSPASLRYRLIFSRLTKLSIAAAEGLSDILIRRASRPRLSLKGCAFPVGDASLMSDGGHFTRLCPEKSGSLITTMTDAAREHPVRADSAFVFRR
jgi:hypothetical protein